MAFFQWSTTPASNATFDPTINLAEGQSPSSLNDSGRAMMARLKEWGNDISGKITTTGSSTAYAIASNQVFDSLAHLDGAMLAFIPHVTNGATVTLNCDGLGAKPLRSAPSVELPSGVMVLGTPYVATYVNADGAFYLQGFVVNPYVIPIGALLAYTGASAPNSSFVIPIGQAINRTTYATYFSLVSTTFGTGDGSTTFNVPDLRGRTVFQVDSGGSGRITVAGGNYDGTVLGNTGGAQNQTLTQAQLPAVAPTFTGTGLTGQGVLANSNVAINGTNQSVTLGGVANNNFGIINQEAVNPGTFVPTGTISNLGFGSSHPILPPSMVLPYILRII